jgi:hypothetical protein
VTVPDDILEAAQKLPPVKLRLFDALVARPMTTLELMHAGFGSSTEVALANVSFLRNRLKPLGWSISRDAGGRHCIGPLPAGAPFSAPKLPVKPTPPDPLPDGVLCRYDRTRFMLQGPAGHMAAGKIVGKAIASLADGRVYGPAKAAAAAGTTPEKLIELLRPVRLQLASIGLRFAAAGADNLQLERISS